MLKSKAILFYGYCFENTELNELFDGVSWEDLILQDKGIEIPEESFSEATFKAYWKAKDELKKRLNIEVYNIYSHSEDHYNYYVAVRDSILSTTNDLSERIQEKDMKVYKEWSSHLEAFCKLFDIDPPTPNWYMITYPIY